MGAAVGRHALEMTCTCQLPTSNSQRICLGALGSITVCDVRQRTGEGKNGRTLPSRARQQVSRCRPAIGCHRPGRAIAAPAAASAQRAPNSMPSPFLLFSCSRRQAAARKSRTRSKQLPPNSQADQSRTAESALGVGRWALGPRGAFSSGRSPILEHHGWLEDRRAQPLIGRVDVLGLEGLGRSGDCELLEHAFVGRDNHQLAVGSPQGIDRRSNRCGRRLRHLERASGSAPGGGLTDVWDETARPRRPRPGARLGPGVVSARNRTRRRARRRALRRRHDPGESAEASPPSDRFADRNTPGA